MFGERTSPSRSKPESSDPGAEAKKVRRLGKNRGQYCGETIDIHDVLGDILRAAGEFGWQAAQLAFEQEGSFPVLSRGRGTSGDSSLYISAGIHGDEPAGPLAVRKLLQENRWPEKFNLWMCPCLNPTGFPQSSRENRHGWDLNRDYRHMRTREVQTHVRWLKAVPDFDLALCLHEDWESQGFYLYELNPEGKPSLAQTMIDAAATVCPVDTSPVIEERPARGGIIRPDYLPDSRPEWPEAFFLIHNKTRLSYTLEAPSDFELHVRVRALVQAVNACLEAL